MRGIVQSLQHVNESVQELEDSLQQQHRRPLNRTFRRANRTSKGISKQVEVVRNMNSRLCEVNDKLKAIAQRNDFFNPDFFSIPNARVPVYLYFTTRHIIDGEWKAKLLESVEHPSCNTSMAISRLLLVFQGWEALTEFTKDADVRNTFSGGGIHLLVMGKGVTFRNLVESLKDIERRPGGKKRCEEIDINRTLEMAVASRKALFICDDV